MANKLAVKLLALFTWLCYYCTTYIQPVLRRFWIVLWTTETTAVRLWFGLVSIFFALFIFESPLFDYYNAEYHLMATISPYWIDSRHFWGILFATNGVALIYGVLFKVYSTKLLILEGLLGVAIWGSSAAAVYYAQGTIGAHTVAAMMALWLLARYPTHAEYVALTAEEDDSEEILEAIHLLSNEGRDGS